MQNLLVNNFGAIKKASIQIRKYNIFIGHTSSGKSTIAKLIAIFNNRQFWSIKNGDFKSFVKLLDKYNINFNFNDDTLISYSNGKYKWNISHDKFETDYNDADLITSANGTDSLDFISKFIEKKSKEDAYKPIINTLKTLITEKDATFSNLVRPVLLDMLYDKCTPVYIPAERLLISIFNNSIFTLLQAGASIPDCIRDFGSLYEKAKIENSDLHIDMLKMKVSFSSNGDIIHLDNDNNEFSLTQASSGIQSIIPLWVVFNKNVLEKGRKILVIEEPELNLFPSTQKKLIEWIMSKMRKSKDSSIVITTHSPYVLSTIDNLILAKEITKKVNKAKRDIILRIKELIPSMALVDFDEVSSYFFGNDGIVLDIRDEELKSLGAEYIDEASDDLSRIFNELCVLEDEL